MPKAIQGRNQPVLAKLFRKAEGLAKTDNAVAVGLLCAVAGYVAANVWGHGPTAFLRGEGAGLGFIVGTAAYTLLSPSSQVTACLVSARKQFLDGIITRSECTLMRKKCLRKSLLY
jgi:hypothetical protein